MHSFPDTDIDPILGYNKHKPILTLSPDINMHFLLTVLAIFRIVSVQRVWFNINTSGGSRAGAPGYPPPPPNI